MSQSRSSPEMQNVLRAASTPSPAVSDRRAPTAMTPAVGYGGSRRRRWRSVTIPYLFLAPFLILFAIFFVFPFIYALKLSVFLDRGITSKFVGFANYSRVLQDANFLEGVKRVLLYGVVQVPVMLGLALLFALLLDSKVVKGKTFFRLTYFIPFAVPGLVAGLLWGYLYSPQLSAIIQITNALGLPKPDFFNDNVLLWSIANITTWEWTGYNMIILVAALQAIPQELYEAARIDGCTGLNVARYIKIPLVRSGLVLTCVLSIIGSLQLFTEPQILGTMTTVNDHYTPNIYAYNYAFSYSAFNYSAAIAFTLAFVAFIFSYGFFWLVNRGQEG